MRQKFKMLAFVTATRGDVVYEGIVAGSYSQIYGGYNVSDYSLFIMQNGKVVSRVAWFGEDELALQDNQDADLAQELIEEYNFRGLT